MFRWAISAPWGSYYHSASVSSCSSVSFRRIMYKVKNVCPFDYAACVVSWKFGTRIQVYLHQLDGCCYSNWYTKSVRNRCVIEVICGVFAKLIGCLIFCWYRRFRRRTESDLVLLLFVIGLSHISSYSPKTLKEDCYAVLVIL